MTGFTLDENSSVPIWGQLKKRLIYLILNGTYQQGDQLPTVRELSSKLEVAYNTVSKVYRDLERDGYIRTKQGKGTFVTYEPDATSIPIDSGVEAKAVEFIDFARSAGLTKDEISELMQRCIDRSE